MVTNSFNVDYKIISKALASKVKNVLPNLISPQQTVYGKHRFIGEGGRLIADIIDVHLHGSSVSRILIVRVGTDSWYMSINLGLA